ncbi:PI-PLC domain-containing protein [Francisella salina]|uniref:Phosphatidylinositol diacylglycerol-lyase n=1 Tax=Francisella salina TaxID=573569 RepID=A0ABM5M6L6_FRAST|nr:hypothetical protein [Francisella salina]AEI34940.1 hypothetical protein F7308_0012 [Francisella salina]
MIKKVLIPVVLGVISISSIESAFAEKINGELYCYVNDKEYVGVIKKENVETFFTDFKEDGKQKQGYLLSNNDAESFLEECKNMVLTNDLDKKSSTIEARFMGKASYFSTLYNTVGVQYGYPLVVKSEDGLYRAGFYKEDSEAVKYDQIRKVSLCVNNSTSSNLKDIQIFSDAVQMTHLKTISKNLESGEGICSDIEIDSKSYLGFDNLISQDKKYMRLPSYTDGALHTSNEIVEIYDREVSEYLEANMVVNNTNQLINISIIDNETKKILTNWLSRVDDETLISNLILPGSHDAGMNEVDAEVDGKYLSSILSRNYVYNQKMRVGSQLMSGSRVMDIRLQEKDDNLVTFHKAAGIGGVGEDIDSILNGSVDFISKYPTEFIILRVSNTGNSAIKLLLDKLKSHKVKDLLFAPSTPIWGGLTVGDARGKIMIIIEPKFFEEIKSTGLDIVLGEKIKKIEEYTSSFSYMRGNTYGGFAGTQKLEQMIVFQNDNANKVNSVKKPIDLDIDLEKDVGDLGYFKGESQIVSNDISRDENSEIFSSFIENIHTSSLNLEVERDFGFQVSWTFTGGFGEESLFSFDIPYFSNNVNARLALEYPRFIKEVKVKPQIVNLDFVSPELIYPIVKDQIYL